MRSAFTLVELMVSVTVLVILMLVVAGFVSLVQRTWVRTNSNVAQFREARLAFDVMTRTIGQATLNTYYQNDFDVVRTDNLGEQVTSPTGYIRQSELQFVCGTTAGYLLTGASASDCPGHGVFFQAPLGVTSRVAQTESNTNANAESLVNLLCGRGYFVAWGDDAFFRPSFLVSNPVVPLRRRLRLMEYRPTAEKNRIYQEALRPITENSKEWFDDALTGVVASATESPDSVAVTRPVAENILALIISPQLESIGVGAAANPWIIAPDYNYDSTVLANAGSGSGSMFGTQGTRHLLPPLLKVTMIALDHLAGERLSQDDALRTEVIGAVGGLFKSASRLSQEIGTSADQLGQLDQLLLSRKINYRVFTTTIAMRQARWSL